MSSRRISTLRPGGRRRASASSPRRISDQRRVHQRQRRLPAKSLVARARPRATSSRGGRGPGRPAPPSTSAGGAWRRRAPPRRWAPVRRTRRTEFEQRHVARTGSRSVGTGCAPARASGLAASLVERQAVGLRRRRPAPPHPPHGRPAAAISTSAAVLVHHRGHHRAFGLERPGTRAEVAGAEPPGSRAEVGVAQVVHRLGGAALVTPASR